MDLLNILENCGIDYIKLNADKPLLMSNIIKAMEKVQLEKEKLSLIDEEDHYPLEVLVNKILPNDSIMYKHDQGMYCFYLSGHNFDKDDVFVTQDYDERFKDFAKRVVSKLISAEEYEQHQEALLNHKYYKEIYAKDKSSRSNNSNE